MKIGEIYLPTKGKDPAFGPYKEVTAPVKDPDDRGNLRIRARRYSEEQTLFSLLKLTPGRVHVDLEKVSYHIGGSATGDARESGSERIESVIEKSRSLDMAARRGARHIGRINSVRMALDMGHRI